MNRRKVVVDAMGGDDAPGVIIDGAAQAFKESKDIFLMLVGNPEIIAPLAEKAQLPADRYEIVAAMDSIGMEESPREALHSKPDASINVAARLIRDGAGDALLSAGSTGATVLACSDYIPRVPGVERGVLAAVLPANKSQKTDPGRSIMLDVGATLHCTANQLVSFAIMGINYARDVMEIDNPRVGLVNIGEEETKGHGELVEANRLLRGLEGVNFVGNIEGKDIIKGVADVIVTEGYIGNVLLKGLEGFADATVETGKRIYGKNIRSKLGLFMLSPIIKKLKKRFDYAEVGGAPILGFRKLIIKAHGRSNAKAIKNAMLLAEKAAGRNLAAHMEAQMKTFYMGMFDGGKGDGKASSE
ncbi:MAG TPA: phosphate acyltransferase PlsX [Calditrichia bacterium]|nr:phosphate acyltransferase PlsX [Calditrichota bacterium]HQV31771.1 phosphate acyltransferase PlsX [Calditrichia bacterium]